MEGEGFDDGVTDDFPFFTKLFFAFKSDDSGFVVFGKDRHVAIWIGDIFATIDEFDRADIMFVDGVEISLDIFSAGCINCSANSVDKFFDFFVGKFIVGLTKGNNGSLGVISVGDFNTFRIIERLRFFCAKFLEASRHKNADFIIWDVDEFSCYVAASAS